MLVNRWYNGSMHKSFLFHLCVIGMLVFLSAEFATAQNIQFSTNLRRGLSGKEVTRLQEFLKTMPDVYPEGMVTGYFGVLTERAVKRFQSKYGVEQAGNVGKKTRAKLNSLYFSQSSRPQEGIPALPKPKQNGAQKQQMAASLAGQFAALEKELLDAKASGSYLAPEHSSRIHNDLAHLENQKYDAAEIKRLRAIVLAASPHLQDKNQTISPQSSPSPPSVSSSAPTGNTVENKPSGKPLVIKNLGVRFEPWDKNSNRAGAFLFLPTENKLFLEYGVDVQGPDGPKILPTFEYRTAKDAEVFAASDGVITKIAYQGQTQDYEILIQPEIGSQWTLGHDHVSAVAVSEGQSVKAGDVLGTAGTLGGALGRTEIMMWGGPASAGRPLTYCPFKLFAPELLSEYQQKVSRHIKEWEEFKGNPDLYAEEKHLFAGCLQETVLD